MLQSPYLIRISFFLICIILVFPVGATHIVGGSINYTHISNDTYEIRTTLYRDCASVPAPSSLIIDAVSSCGSVAFELDSVDMDTTVYCSSLQNSCNGGALPGIEWILYIDTVEITPCSDWFFSYDICCRATSQNITNSYNENFYLESKLDNSNQTNSSPIFNQSLNLVAEVNEPFCVNNNAFDTDGDSLVYSVITPYSSSGNNVVYEPGFSLSNPTGAGSNFTFNQNSGNICFTPNIIGNFVLAVRIDEYRNNVIVGSTVRDFQISIVSGVAIASQNITGTVTDGNGNPVPGVNVELFEYGISLGNLTLAANQSTNSSGDFSFTGQDVGQYLIRSQPSSGYIPTYHESTAYWQHAQVVYLMCDAQVTSDITLVDQNNPLGTGVIAGYLNGSGVVKSGGDPMEGVSILLYEINSDTLVQHGITDQNGYYELENIPDGSYYLLVDIEGLAMVSTHFINLQEGEAIAEANFFADENGINKDGDYSSQGFVSLTSDTKGAGFNIYPNPGSNMILIDSESYDSFNVKIYNSTGQKVQEAEENKGSLQINVSELSKGSYQIVIKTSDTLKTVKWIKL